MNTLSINMRPSHLGEFIGNEEVVESLRKQMSATDIPVAILFQGPPGTGKTTLALIAARLAQGFGYPEDAPIDLTEVNCGDENGVDAMRALVDGSSFLPLVGRRKVYVLNEAQKLTDAAQQCLLDPTEKKGSSALFIFTTTDPEKINTALKTRCKIFRLRGMAEAQIVELIRKASDALEVEYDDVFVKYAAKRSSNWSARELLNAYEMYKSGTSLEKSFSVTSPHEPLYADIAKATLRGDWIVVSSMLAQIKTPDIRGLRAVISAFLRGALIKSEPGARADAIATCLMGMGSPFDDGTAYALTTACLYKCCRHLGGK